MIQSDFLVNVVWITSLLSIIIIPLIPLRFKSSLAVASVILNSLIISYISVPALSGNVVEISQVVGSVFGNVTVRIDTLSAWFILIINLTCITGVLYGKGYMEAYKNSSANVSLHWIMYIIFQLSMVTVCAVQNGLVFLIVWEIMSLSSMMLVIFDNNNSKTIKAGINYLIQMHISIVFLTIGFIWIYYETGSFNFENIGLFFAKNNNIWLFLIFFAGFGLKAGFYTITYMVTSCSSCSTFSYFRGYVRCNRKTGYLWNFTDYNIFKI